MPRAETCSCGSTPCCGPRRRRAGPRSSLWTRRTSTPTPIFHRRLVRLRGYSPDFNADEAIGGWVRGEVTANTCFGTATQVREHVGRFFRDLTDRAEEVKRRCRTVLQARAEGLAPVVAALLQDSQHVDPTL